MSVKTKQIIYELDEEESDSPKKIKKGGVKSQILERKLGLVTYVKWGNVYNYQFSFDLNKGRLLCYKLATSKNINNYYALIQGCFVESEEEIQKWEKIFQKKKNYVAPPSIVTVTKKIKQDDPDRSAIYVRTKKGKTFRLVTNSGESHDKIMGYLQMCFNSKLSAESKSFFAMLGVGVIQVHQRGYKINTGILVPLDNWGVVQNPQNYLKSPEAKKPDQDPSQKIGQLVNNVSVIGALISAFQTPTLSLIFNPSTQTVDVILFDNSGQPNQFLHQIFQLVKKSKKHSIMSNGNLPIIHQGSNNSSLQQKPGQLMKLHTLINMPKEIGEYIQIAENKSVQILCKKCYKEIIIDDGDIQEGMFKSSIAEDQIGVEDPEDERPLVSQALNFYKKALSYHPKQDNPQQDDTREFIMVNPFNLQRQDVADDIFRQSPRRDDPAQGEIGDEIPLDLLTIKDDQYCISEEDPDGRSDGLIQAAKSINVQMNRHKSFSSTQSPPQQYMEQFQQLQQTPIKEEPPAPLPEVIVPVKVVEEPEPIIVAPPPQEQLVQVKQEQFIEKNEDEDFVEDDDNGGDDNEEAAIAKAGAKDSFPTQTIKGYKNIMKYAMEFQWINAKDEYRVEKAHKSGGTACVDQGIVNLSRSVGKTMIKEIGRKIISGNFNLTTVSFPIKAMIPRSALEKSFMQTILFPLYLNRAASNTSPVERMKLVMVATICNYIQANTFLKPLNPIIGETFEGSYDDGTQLYSEQISHHPPVSYFLVIGPQKSYRFWGYYLYEAKAGLNSLVLSNKGKRMIEFGDGHRINYDFNHEQYSGTFMGTMKHESTGTLTFRDEKNGLVGNMNFGKVKKRPTDFVDGEIKQGTKVLSRLYGSYLGFLEWDNVRYWDCRHVLPFKLKV